MRRLILLAAAPLAAGLAAPAGAETAIPTPDLIRNLSQCLKVADDAERLACLEQQARALTAASESGDLVAVQRDEVRELERESFGLSLDSVGNLVGRLAAIGGGGAGEADTPGEEREPESQRLEAVTLTIASASEYQRGKLRFVFENGQVWEQTTSDTIFLPHDPAGIPAEIRSGSLGSFLIRVRGQRSVPVRRVQ